MYQIIFYRDKKGINEVEKYIRELERKNDKESRIKYEKISVYFELLSRNGLQIGEPYIKHLAGDLWELRPLRDRIIFGYVKYNKFIILSRFIKKTKKTPNREIKNAFKLLKIFKEEMKNEKEN